MRVRVRGNSDNKKKLKKKIIVKKKIKYTNQKEKKATDRG